MKKLNWSNEKNQQLKKERGVSFDDIIQAIGQQKVLDIIKHPNQNQYPNQFVLIVHIKNYVYCVPYVENETEIFLKTIFPSRKMKKRYLGD